MLRFMRVLGSVALIGLAAGCEWSTGSGVTSYNSRYNWVNFSGVYRGINGGVLVTDFTSTPGTPGVTNTINNELVGTANGSSTTFSGVFSKKPVVPGSVTITTAGFNIMTDDGAGALAGGGKSGTIDYGTGAWSIDLAPSAPDAGTQIRASYQFSVSGSAGSGAPGSGATKVTIFSFTLFQQGEKLVLTDNNGSEYIGRTGSIRTTGGGEGTVAPIAGTTVIAQYNVEGTSAAGIAVNIVGTLQGVVTASVGNQFALSDRRIFGTWIEKGGRTGDINGQASPVQIVFVDEEVEPAVTP